MPSFRVTFLKNVELLPDIVSTSMCYIITSESVRMLHPVIFNLIKELIIYFLYSEENLSHPGNPYGKLNPLRSYAMNLFRSLNSIIEEMQR